MPAAKKTKLEAVDDDVEAVAEPVSEFVEIPFNDATFVVARDRDEWPTEGLAYLAEQKYNLFVKSLLEMAKTGQWDTLCRLCPHRKDFNEFFAVFGDVINEECVG